MPLGGIGQDQGLARQDLAAGVRHRLAVDRHQALGDQGLGLAPRAHAGLREPLVHALGFALVVAPGESHGLATKRNAPGVPYPRSSNEVVAR